jgi:cytochrome c-type biogenesis protein CcmH/NrfG
MFENRESLSATAGVFLLVAGFTVLFAVLDSGCSRADEGSGEVRYAGSESCRECHEEFYRKWDTSHHGKAMQPFTREFAQKELTPLEEPFRIKDRVYTVDLEKMVMHEKSDGGDAGEFKFVHALGGKNLYYFLTPLERGKLQVLPLAYNTLEGFWYDTTTSMMRHFLTEEDEPLSWRDPLLTFNTSCYGCHVSQISKNYDVATDTYKTEWREPGISCESCHGPGEAHNRAFRKAAKNGTTPDQLYLASWDDYTFEQSNHACSTCHAKFSPITQAFNPGDHFYDHFDLICLENLDYSCEGRDLGENYTFTLWSMSPCVKSGQLDCVHCHTSSGRYRFAEQNPNDACAKCHGERVKTITRHSRHPADGKTGQCISCHMPMTSFAMMRRCDHSMRPPSPEASARFKNQSACIICHTAKTEEWAAGFVKKWFPESTWQKRIVHEGSLIEAARKADWSKLPEILRFIADPESDAIFVTSLIRLVQLNPDTGAWAPAVRALAGHADPLVRGTVAAALAQDIGSHESVQALFRFLKDERRLVRVRAVTSLSRYPWQRLDQETRSVIEQAEREVMDMFGAMPDAWSNYYNKGNYLSDRGDDAGAMQAYKTAMRLRPDVIISFVNAAVLASRQGKLNDAVNYLRQAQKAAPEDGAVNLNLGLALAEQGDRRGAIQALRTAMKDKGCRAQAAFNCAVLSGETDLDEAIRLIRIAVQEQPENQRYQETLEYYQQRKAASGQ